MNESRRAFRLSRAAFRLRWFVVLAACVGLTGAVAPPVLAHPAREHASSVIGSGDARLVRAAARTTRSPADRRSQTVALNQIVPPFQGDIVRVADGPDRWLLKSNRWRPISSDENWAGSCLDCAGSGRYGAGSLSQGILTWTVSGTIQLTASSTVIAAVWMPGELGRFRAYGFNHNGVQVLQSQWCLPADVLPADATTKQVLGLPPIPCDSVATPGVNVVALNVPAELSAQAGSFVVSGHAGMDEWLTVTEGGSSCAPDLWAQLKVAKDGFWKPIKVRGGFNVTLHGDGAMSPGTLCAYLQQDEAGYRRAEPHVNVPVPIGPVAALTASPYFVGDRIAVSGPTTAPAAGSTFSLTLTGYSSGTEELYLLGGTAPCAATAQADYAATTTTQVADFALTAGTISRTVNQAPASATYQCAYLQDGPPTQRQGTPTGQVLATGSWQEPAA